MTPHGPCVPRIRAACMVSQEPLITRPAIIRNNPTKISGDICGLLLLRLFEAPSRGTTNNGMPISSGTTRQSFGARVSSFG